MRAQYRHDAELEVSQRVLCLCYMEVVMGGGGGSEERGVGAAWRRPVSAGSRGKWWQQVVEDAGRGLDVTEQSQLGGKEMEPVTGHGKAEQSEVLAGATGNSERRKRQGRQACGCRRSRVQMWSRSFPGAQGEGFPRGCVEEVAG